MLDEIFFVLVAAIVLIAAAIVRPARAACPPAFYVEGVRPTGSSQCLRVPPPGPGCPGSTPCPEPPPDRVRIPVQIYCASSMRPLVVNERVIACVPRRRS